MNYFELKSAVGSFDLQQVSTAIGSRLMLKYNQKRLTLHFYLHPRFNSGTICSSSTSCYWRTLLLSHPALHCSSCVVPHTVHVLQIHRQQKSHITWDLNLLYFIDYFLDSLQLSYLHATLPVCVTAWKKHQNWERFCSKSKQILFGTVFSINDSFHCIPPPQMRADTQTFTEISFLLLPRLGPIGFEQKPAGEVRKRRGLHWLDLLGTAQTHRCVNK